MPNFNNVLRMRIPIGIGDVKSISIDNNLVDWMPTLETPSMSIANNVVTITASQYATSYDILVDDNVEANTSSLTYDLKQLTYSTIGNHTIEVVAKANQHHNSLASNSDTITAYEVSYSITNGSASGTSVVIVGQGGSGTISADAYYNLPSSISISGATLSNYDDTTGAFSFTNASGAVSISATCPA